MLAVRREHVVVVAQGTAGADLGGLLAEQRGPQAQLALALEGGRLAVEAAGQDHVAVEPAQVLGRDVLDEGEELRGVGIVRCADPFTLGRQQLYELGLGVLRGGGSLGSGALAALAAPAARLVPLLRRGLRAAVLSTVTCCSSVGPAPGFSGVQCGSPGSVPAHKGGCASCTDSGVTGAPASALRNARYPVRRITAKPHLTCVFAWISK